MLQSILTLILAVSVLGLTLEVIKLHKEIKELKK